MGLLGKALGGYAGITFGGGLAGSIGGAFAGDQYGKSYEYKGGLHFGSIDQSLADQSSPWAGFSQDETNYFASTRGPNFRWADYIGGMDGNARIENGQLVFNKGWLGDPRIAAIRASLDQRRQQDAQHAEYVDLLKGSAGRDATILTNSGNDLAKTILGAPISPQPQTILGG